MQNQECEIAICGAGPVGLALALLLRKRGMANEQMVVLDGSTLEKSQQDPRSIALSYGSKQILESIHAWPLPASAIEQIHISRRGHFGRTVIDQREHHLPALGYVTRYGQIVSKLALLAQQQGIKVMRPVQWQSHSEDNEGVTLQLKHSGDEEIQSLHAKIVVRAEGGVFAQQDEKKLHRDYGQSAVIAEVRVSNPQLQRAFERFTDQGPLALLPLPATPSSQDTSSPHYSLVWCVKHEKAAELLGLEDEEFLSALEAEFGGRLGHFCSSTPRVAFKLGLNAQPTTSARSVAIGNAAQTLHPVAGQGLNLGLRDASVLARLLAMQASSAQLQRFMAQREPDRNLTVKLTDTMARIFTLEQSPLPQSWLGLSLGLFDLLAPARHGLAQLMMFGRR